jgi:hypothetical protein
LWSRAQNGWWGATSPVVRPTSASTSGLVAETQRTRAELLQKLDSERGVLQKEIEEVRTFERNYRAHLQSYLEGQLIELGQTGTNETG